MFPSVGRNILSNVQLNRISSCLAIKHILKVSQRNHTNAYEGDGKTTIKILNKDPEFGLMVNTFSQYGFRLNNGLKIVGPMAIFPKSVLSWDIGSIKDINEASLSLFCILEPKIDILVLGIGSQKITREFSEAIFKITRKYKINVELLQTEQACATFNFLNAEQRMVAGGMIPPTNISFTENDLMQDQASRDEVFDTDNFKLK